MLHLFPNPNKDPDRVEAWRKAVGGKILELSFEHIYKYRRVCRAHFEDKFHCRYERLSNISIPTVNMAGMYFNLIVKYHKILDQNIILKHLYYLLTNTESHL